MTQHLVRQRAMPVLANVEDQIRGARRPVIVVVATDNLAEVPKQRRTHGIAV